jgi:uroporphyrin-III C-methyltransferase
VTDTTSVSTSVAPATPAQPNQHSAGARWVLALMVLATAASVLAAWSAQHRVQQLESELVRRQQDSQKQSQEAQLLARQAQDAVKESIARTAMLEARLAEVALQRGQVEDLIQSMSRSRDENLVVDVESALLLAQQQASLTGSPEALIVALQTAEARLAHANQPRLEPVRRALAKDMDRLKSTQVADLNTLAIKVDEAIRLIDELPLISQPPKTMLSPRARSAPAASSPGQAAPEPAPTTWTARLLNWGARASHVAWSEAQGLVRVTQISRPEAMLMSPEQGFLLRENIKLRLLNARLNLLSRQIGSASADIQLAQQSLTRYFDAQSAKTRLVMTALSEVAGQSPLTQVPRPDDTLAALATVSGGH